MYANACIKETFVWVYCCACFSSLFHFQCLKHYEQRILTSHSAFKQIAHWQPLSTARISSQRCCSHFASEFSLKNKTNMFDAHLSSVISYTHTRTRTHAHTNERTERLSKDEIEWLSVHVHSGLCSTRISLFRCAYGITSETAFQITLLNINITYTFFDFFIQIKQSEFPFNIP